MFRRKTRIKLEKIKQEMYETGLRVGYKLGYQMGKVDRTNKGFITGAIVQEQIEEILRHKE